MSDKTYVLFYVIEFSDNGHPEGGLWHRGTQDDCELVRSRIPAIMYSGSRPNPQPSVFMAPEDEIPLEIREALGLTSCVASNVPPKAEAKGRHVDITD